MMRRVLFCRPRDEVNLACDYVLAHDPDVEELGNRDYHNQPGQSCIVLPIVVVVSFLSQLLRLSAFERMMSE